MAHPYQEHKQYKVEHNRVAHITKGYARGGAVHEPVVGGAPTAKAISQRDAQAVEGKPARERMDRRARGGRTGKSKKGTHVNVIVAPQGGAMAGGPPPAPSPGVGGPPPVAARPPMPMPPPGAGPPMAPGAIRSHGGRTYARGGAVKSGPAWAGGIKSGTPVQHTGNKSDTANIGRGKPITYATGGPVEHPAKGGMGPKFGAGAGGGKGRLAKARLYGP